MAEPIADAINSPVVQILSELIAWGLITPHLAQKVLEYLYDHFGEEIFH